MIFNSEDYLSYKRDKKSNSQIDQDLFVRYMLQDKLNGYFVDFGATDGISYSNSYIFEKEYGWSGIVCEPNKFYQPDLLKNRICHIDFNCVYDQTGRSISFYEVDQQDLSTISIYSDKDHHKEARKKRKEYQVDTISLKDLMDKYNAPKIIDYLSIDTEGSEYTILSNYDFSRSFKVITVEHNHVEDNRNKIYSLLTEKGYERIPTEFSSFDDWYVLYII